ncbi:hypothetical protein PPERSA_04372 [Pseudocohnilembus persalinus]|uniref:Tetratricopeptide repeat protein n=1 Tax=Pseudocohnilembus persalinus TaxID=266149 RepID=A0A0V0QQV8_PSEPJ|nr:hypothetical protein PPERSA_04372 [Pseudocohnilembus persalinus]|eukprot:KRX04557.1 hypothetical protein PPERSA_04372 [Pseudocohnilembus persalinus]
MNNWGCFYRREGEDEKALEAFRQSLKYKQEAQTEQYKGSIYLNLGALLSQKGKKNKIIDNCDDNDINNLDTNNKNEIIQQLQQNQNFVENVQNLAIALYNIGSEEEILQNNDQAIQNYRDAWFMAQNNLEFENPLVKQLRKFYLNKLKQESFEEEYQGYLKKQEKKRQNQKKQTYMTQKKMQNELERKIFLQRQQKLLQQQNDQQ